MNDAQPTRLSETTPDPWLGKEINGYRIESVIGRGGMGVVYKAIQLSLSRPVAIKVIPETFVEHPQFVERFHREVDVLSKLSHPNVVTVFERGEVDGRLYVVMEFVEGTSLRDVIKAGPLPKTEALSIVRSVLQALEHAHERGVVHRDIKPENVLVAPGGIVKVADFGLSRLLGPQDVTRLTHTHLLLGTFEYMAPEQREKAKEADERSDLYATGVVLYEMLAGELPIGNFDPLSEKRPQECDARIDEIVSKSLQKAPEKRYQGAAEMGNAVSRVLSAAFAPPPESKPEPLPPRRRDPYDRSGSPVGVIAVIGLILLCVLGVFFVLFQSLAPVGPEEELAPVSPALAPERPAPTPEPQPMRIGLGRIPAGFDDQASRYLFSDPVTEWAREVGGSHSDFGFELDKRTSHLVLSLKYVDDPRQARAVAAAYQLLLERWWGVETDRVARLREMGILGEFEARVAKTKMPPPLEKKR